MSLHEHDLAMAEDENHQQSNANESCTENLEKLEMDEDVLAKKLESYCTVYGKEKRKFLLNSAIILQKIGEVYLEKAVYQTKMYKKLSYLKCGVLLHAANARFKTLGYTIKLDQTENTLQGFSKSLLEACGSESKAILTDISRRFVTDIRSQREEMGRILNRELRPDDGKKTKSLEMLEMFVGNENLTWENIESKFLREIEEEEREIVKKVKSINDRVTRFYMRIMGEIAMECLCILPPPPCKFAIAGLGSLARGEITLYSDFEHIILLEEGVDQWGDYESVLEYFRWFTVIFQIIIVGFGETLVPSVTVKSLNDIYFEKSGRNWFHDSFTPKGIAFDGMFPHSCNIPLGRQQPTKLRPDIVELIKTPKVMANYMTSDEELKNGYYLADILRQTCLVYGDERIYAAFEAERVRVLKENKTTMERYYLQTIVGNSIKYVRECNFTVRDLATFDSKPVFYRPLATLIGFIGKYSGIHVTSTFENIKKLKERGLLCQNLCHKLSYGFAVACEIRMKLYHKVHQQRHLAQLQILDRLVGEDGVLSCKDMMSYCREIADLLVKYQSTAPVEEYNKIYIKSHPYKLLRDLSNHGHWEECIKIGEKLKLDANPDVADFHKITMLSAYCFAACHNETQEIREMYFQKAEAVYNELKDRSLKCDVGQILNMRFQIANVYKNQGEGQKCIETLEEYFSLRYKARNLGITYDVFMDACDMYYDVITYSELHPEVVKFRLCKLWDTFKENLECQLYKRYYFATRHFPYKRCCMELKTITADIRKHINKLLLPASLLIKIIEGQVFMWCLDDAIESIELILQKLSRSTQSDVYSFESINADALKFLCLCRTGEYQKVQNWKCKKQDLLIKFAFKLWRGIHQFSCKSSSIIVLLWTIYMMITGCDVFSPHANAPDFFRVREIESRHRALSSAQANIASRLACPYFSLLLAKSLN